jgi:hypothetical protein
MHKELLGIISGIVLCGVNRNIKKKTIQVWRLCTSISKRKENMSWKIYQKVVWFVHSIVLPTK